MKVFHIPKKSQVTGQFDNGNVQERKPLAFPQEGGPIRPWSQLIYWAHAWSDNGGLIDLHPHQAYCIATYVIDGELEHYDTTSGSWQQLTEGDLQVMHAGSGLMHAEKLLPGNRIFQLWFNVDVEAELENDPQYSDYSAGEFPVYEDDHMTSFTVVGEGSPVHLVPGVTMRRALFDKGKYELPVEEGASLGLLVVSGAVKIGESFGKKHDFFVIFPTGSLVLEATEDADVFVVELQQN